MGEDMIKHLTKHGNSLALVIERPILELLGIAEDTPLSINSDGKCLIISPVRNPVKKKRVREALEKVNKRHGEALRRLAE
jgi:antitoxin component of MazEF toxin-antitoxin module